MAKIAVANAPIRSSARVVTHLECDGSGPPWYSFTNYNSSVWDTLGFFLLTASAQQFDFPPETQRDATDTRRTTTDGRPTAQSIVHYLTRICSDFAPTAESNTTDTKKMLAAANKGNDRWTSVTDMDEGCVARDAYATPVHQRRNANGKTGSVMRDGGYRPTGAACDSAFGDGRGRRMMPTREELERGSPSKRKGSAVGVVEDTLSAVDEAIESMMTTTIGATTAAVRALGRTASYFTTASEDDEAARKKRDDEDDGYTRRRNGGRVVHGKENVEPLAPRAMSFGNTPMRAQQKQTQEVGPDLRGVVDDLRRALAESTKKCEELKKQNLALQRREIARDSKSAESALVEQLRTQVEALMSEKASMARENATLRRENKTLSDYMVYSGVIEEDNGDDDFNDVSGASSGDIEELSPQEIAALEREIADLEASLNNSDSTLEYSPDKSTTSDSGASCGGI